MSQFRFRVERLKTGEVVARVDSIAEALALWNAEEEQRKHVPPGTLSMAFYPERVDAAAPAAPVDAGDSKE